MHISRFGVIPKHNQPGKWHLILDLSYPKDRSVNTSISKPLYSFQYASVDDARIITDLGLQTHLAKIDIVHAYRNILFHPDDRHLLGMEWQNQIFIDTALPFGLRQRFAQYLMHLSGSYSRKVSLHVCITSMTF